MVGSIKLLFEAQHDNYFSNFLHALSGIYSCRALSLTKYPHLGQRSDCSNHVKMKRKCDNYMHQVMTERNQLTMCKRVALLLHVIEIVESIEEF